MGPLLPAVAEEPRLPLLAFSKVLEPSEQELPVGRQQAPQLHSLLAVASLRPARNQPEALGP